MNRFGSRPIQKVATGLAIAFAAGSPYAEFAIWAIILGGASWLAS